MAVLFIPTQNNDQLTSTLLNSQLAQLETAILARTPSFVRLVANTEIGSPVANIDIQNIPQTRKNLFVVLTVRSDEVDVAGDFLSMYFNNSTTAADYASMHNIVTSGAATVVNNATGSRGNIQLGRLFNASNAAALFDTYMIDINDYTSTSVWKTTHHKSNHTSSGSIFGGGVWNTLNAINRITFVPDSAGNFIAGCSYAIYGHN